MRINIDGTVYVVLESDDDVYQFMVKSATPISPQVVTLLNFYFFTGSPSDVTKQFSAASNIVADKTPFVWLPLTTAPRLRVLGDASKSFRYRYNNLRTFFLASTYYDRWNDLQRMDNVINYIEPYCNEFIAAMSRSGVIMHKIDYDLLPLVRFANTDNKGFITNILDQTQLSAIELDITFRSEIKCEQCAIN